MSSATLKKRPFRPAPFTLLIVVLAVGGTAHILVRTATYGAAVGTDSTLFLFTALNFLAGEGWRDFTGEPMVGWPPLFPLVLAAFGWVGIEPLAAGRWVNAAAFGLTILAAGCWLRSNLRSRWLGLAATATLAVSLPLSELASNFLSDPLFVLFTLLALIWLASFLQRGGRTPLLLGAVFTALAALTRYPGGVLICTGVLLLLVRRAPPFAVRLKHSVVFGAGASIPLAGVLTRNWVVAETLTGYRKGSGQSLSDALSRVVDVFREWAIPPDALDGMSYLLWMAVGLVVLADRSFGVCGHKGTARPASPLFGLGPAIPFGVFVVAYLVFVVAIVPLVVPMQISARYLLPVYVPLLLAVVFLLDQFLSIEVAGRVAAARWVLTALVVLATLAHVGFSARKNLGLTAQALESGYPDDPDGAYNIAYWQHSATLHYVRTHLSDSRTYSNNHFLVWFADRTVAFKKHKALPSRLRDWTRDARKWVNRGEAEVYIVWIKNDYRSAYYDYNDLDIRFLPGVETVAEASDGVVFRVTTATAAEPFDKARLHTQKERYVAQLLEQAGERVVRSDWDVYRTGRKLTYFKKPCVAADVQAKFILHIVPADPGVLSISRKRHGYDNLGFYFDRGRRGVRVGDQCIMTVDLPAYAIGRVRVGQWVSKENRTVWEAELTPSR